MTCPLSEPAPSASVIFNPVKRSPSLSVVQFRAPSTRCSGLKAFAFPTEFEGGSEIDRKYQYFAKNRAPKLYWPGTRLRSAKTPSLSGLACVPRNRRNPGWLDESFSLRCMVTIVSANNGRRLSLHSGAGEDSSVTRPTIEPSGLVVNSMPVTSAPLTLMPRGSDAATSPVAIDDCAVRL